MRVTVVSFRAIRYINEPQYLPGVEESREHRRLRTREGDVAFKCLPLRSGPVYREQEILHLVSLKNIKSEGKLILHYSMKYSFL